MRRSLPPDISTHSWPAQSAAGGSSYWAAQFAHNGVKAAKAASQSWKVWVVQRSAVVRSTDHARRTQSEVMAGRVQARSLADPSVIISDFGSPEDGISPLRAIAAGDPGLVRWASQTVAAFSNYPSSR